MIFLSIIFCCGKLAAERERWLDSAGFVLSSNEHGVSSASSSSRIPRLRLASSAVLALIVALTVALCSATTWQLRKRQRSRGESLFDFVNRTLNSRQPTRVGTSKLAALEVADKRLLSRVLACYFCCFVKDSARDSWRFPLRLLCRLSRPAHRSSRRGTRGR